MNKRSDKRPMLCIGRLFNSESAKRLSLFFSISFVTNFYSIINSYTIKKVKEKNTKREKKEVFFATFGDKKLEKFTVLLRLHR